MTVDVNLSTIISTLLSGLALAGIAGIFRVLRSMNASITKLQEWSIGHEKLDDERFASQKEQNVDIWKAIQWIRERLTG